MPENTNGIPTYTGDGRFIGYECPVCFSIGEYSTQWDSFACLNCCVWLDATCKCTEDSCPYANRPEFPIVHDTPFGKVL